VSTFQELADKEIDEVRLNDPVITPSDAWSRVHFSAQSLGDIVRHFLACKMTETEAMGHTLSALVNVANVAQHSAEALGLCNAPEAQEHISDEFRQDCHAAVKWMAEYIKENMKMVRSTQLGGEDRFSVEFDASTLEALFQLSKGEE
jgi:lysyl-tRNA synthetase class I